MKHWKTHRKTDQHDKGINCRMRKLINQIEINPIYTQTYLKCHWGNLESIPHLVNTYLYMCVTCQVLTSGIPNMWRTCTSNIWLYTCQKLIPVFGISWYFIGACWYFFVFRYISYVSLEICQNFFVFVSITLILVCISLYFFIFPWYLLVFVCICVYFLEFVCISKYLLVFLSYLLMLLCISW
jgi:hypothetical protein